jgi:serine/threonine-protein kinase
LRRSEVFMARIQIDCPSCGARPKADAAYCAECGFPIGQLRGEDKDALVGRTLAGGYRVVDHIASGSMGEVYRAEQANLGRAVAVKVMSNSLVADPQMVARFHNEARAASSLNHPNCVRVYDYGETPDGRPYIVMELLQGQELAALLSRDRKPPVSRVLDITLQILSALDESHGLGVVHRDLKPENVFVLPQRGGGDLVKVVDFGLAKLRTGVSSKTTSGSGQVFGTPEYMAPEQAMAKETDHRTDLYSCGVMLFEMLAGRLPFQSDSAHELLEKHVYDAPPRLAAVAADRAAFGLDEILEVALRKDPAERFQSAEAFADSLREVVAYRTGERSMSDRRSWIRQSFRPCPNCSARVLVTAKFCGECGDALPRESITSPLAATDLLPPSVAPLSGEQTFSSGRVSIPPPNPRLNQLTESSARGLEQAIRDALDSGDANSTIVFLEQIAMARLKSGDAIAAIVALKRGIEVARMDLDRGELDDPIRAVAILSAKLGDAYAAAGELTEAHRAYKDALSLTRAGSERTNLWTSLSRLAREQGHEGDAIAFLEAAEREADSSDRRGQTPERESRPVRSRRRTGEAG